jgi:hypothetical protein
MDRYGYGYLTKDIFRDADTPDYVVETYNTDTYNPKMFKCVCGSICGYKEKSQHTKTKRHIKYMEQNLKIQEIQEIALPLPATTPEIQEIPIPDVIPEPIQEIPASIPDTSPTKLEIARKKKQEYMREYMRKYHAKRYNEDEEYRKYRIEMTNKSSCVMRSRYIKAYQYIKENKIAIFDEKGN